ncbi:hypothetical protein D3C84_69860 [compost metagenome]
MVGGCGTCRGHRIPPPPTQAGGFVPDCPLRRRLPGCLPVSTLHIGPNCGPETLPQVPALADAIHHTPPLAGGPPGHRAGRRPGASSMHPRRRWPPWATVPVGSPGQQHDPAPPLALARQAPRTGSTHPAGGRPEHRAGRRPGGLPPVATSWIIGSWVESVLDIKLGGGPGSAACSGAAGSHPGH